MREEKNRYNRKKLSRVSIIQLATEASDLISHEKYISLFTDRQLDSYYKWKNDVIRNLDSSSCNFFFFLLESIIPNCKFCSVSLTEKEYSYGSRKLGAKGFKKYCNSCQLDEKWKFRKKSCGEVEKIRTSLRKWAKTERGQEYYKTRGAENSNFMRLYSHSKEGIESRINARKKQSETMKKK